MKNLLEQKYLLLVLLVVLGMVTPPQVFADNTTAAIEQRLADLEAQVAELKQELQQQKQAAAQNAQQATVPQVSNSTTPQAPSTAIVTADNKDGFSIKSPDGNYKLKIGAFMQLEARDFAANNKEELGETNSILPRRVMLTIKGTVDRDFDFFLQPTFGYNNTLSTITSTTPNAYAPALYQAWVDYKYFPEATIVAGKVKTPFDLENLQQERDNPFTELGLTSNFSPQRDLGVQLTGKLFDDRITYAGGLFDGAADRENGNGGYSTSANGDTNSRSGTGRVFIIPFKDTSIDPLKGLGVGYAVSYGKEKGSDLPTFVTPGQAPIFNYNSGVSAAGPQLRTAPQAYYYYRSLGILAEKVTDKESLEYARGANIYRLKPDNEAWEVTGSYFLTGENNAYGGITPNHDFDPSQGHWGAFELVARYGELKMDSSIFSENFANLNTSISDERAWAMGMDWYLNKNLKLSFYFEQTKFDRGAIDGKQAENRKTENLFNTTVQWCL